MTKRAIGWDRQRSCEGSGLSAPRGRTSCGPFCVGPMGVATGVSRPVEPSLDELAINTIRTLSMDAVQKANSGHPGLPMGAAAMAYVLWTRFLRHNPANPKWPDRDRFVLSAGHGSMIEYALLHLTGYDVTLD